MRHVFVTVMGLKPRPCAKKLHTRQNPQHHNSYGKLASNLCHYSSKAVDVKVMGFLTTTLMRC